MKARIVKAKPEHIEPIAINMRDADKVEVWLSGRHTPYEALEYSAKSRRCWTAINQDDEPFCMFGVADDCLVTNKGSPWLLATDEMMNHQRELLVYSKRYTQGMIQEFDVLENFVHSENEHSIRWLKWLGYELVELLPVGHKSAPFWRFRMEKDYV